jgi:hypothetical protein
MPISVLVSTDGRDVTTLASINAAAITTKK